MAAGPVRRRIIVRGRVQGVGFRYSTVHEARRLGLRGWARNAPDGSVEILVEGSPAAVEQLTDWCRHGPPSARVASVHLTEEPQGEALGDFGVR